MSNSSNVNPQDKLDEAKDRAKIFNKFLTVDHSGATPNKPTFVYKGVQSSPYKEDIESYPDRLKQKPAEPVIFKPYPKVGELPQIDQQGLEFLDQDIKEACICIGRFAAGKLQAHWLGRNALSKAQFWSGTKIIPLLNVVCQLSAKFPDSDIDNCVIRDPENKQKDTPLVDIASEIISYQQHIASSNSLAAMCKRFETWEGLESWTRKITGNSKLDFRGRYGEVPFINQPELFDLKKQRVLLKAAPETARGDNLLTAYDLARFISMLGWHHHLPQEARFPGAQWSSLEAVVRAMGTDPCRYIDMAIQTLGLEDFIASPVILSKLGNGFSDSRNSTEIVYVALVQFVDQLPQAEKKPAIQRTVTMVLRGSKPLQETNPEAIEQQKNRDAAELDSTMAAEVTEILRRVVTEELV
jgi:hypothetical protein